MRRHCLKLILMTLSFSAITATPYEQLVGDLVLKMKDKDLKKVFTVLPFKAKGKKSGPDEETTNNVIFAMQNINMKIGDRNEQLFKEIELSQKGVGSQHMDLSRISNASIAILGIVHYLDTGSKAIFIKAVDLKTFLILSTAEVVIGKVEDGEISDTELLNSLGEQYFWFYDSFFDKIHFSAFIGSGWDTSLAAPVNVLDTVYLSGPPLFYWLRLGYPLNRNIILFIHAQNSILFNPLLGASNNILTQSRLNDVKIALIDVGMGISWYLLPSRFFLSFSLGDSSALYKDTKNKVNINFGFGANLSFGYHRKVSRSFGIGYLLGLYFSHLEFSDINVAIPTKQGFVNDNVFDINTVTVYAGVFIAIN